MKNHHLKVNAKEELLAKVYEKSQMTAVRFGRRWGVVDPAAAEDIASAAYLSAARGALAQMDAATVKDADGFADAVAYRSSRGVLRRESNRQRKFEESFLRLDDPDPETRIDPSDHGAGCERMLNELDGETPMPFWRLLTKLTVDGLPPGLKRVAKGFMTDWDPEKVRKKTKYGHAKFYRSKKRLKKLLRPCFIAYLQHEHGRFRPRK